MNNLVNRCNFPWDKAFAPNLHAINHYLGCSFDCQYPCWAKDLATRFKRLPSTGNWRGVEVAPKFKRLRYIEGFLEELYTRPSLKRATILLSSTCDPYPPLEKKEVLTFSILKTLQRAKDKGCWEGKLLILTKSPLVLEDWETLKDLNAWVGFTLTTPSGVDTKPWEPYAPSNAKRIGTLRGLHLRGIKTFASIEPLLALLSRFEAWGVWPPFGNVPENIPAVYVPNNMGGHDRFYDITQPVRIIEATHEFVNYFILGSWNRGGKPLKDLVPFYRQELPKVIEALERYAPGRYFIKPELEKVLEDG